jgi:hypothetical protein
VWIFFIFWSNKIRIVSSLSPPWCRLSSGRHRHAIASCHTSFPWSQDERTASASSSDNASSHRLPSRTETEALNPHHHHLPHSSDRLTSIIHCYKKVVSILATLPTTQPSNIPAVNHDICTLIISVKYQIKSNVQIPLNSIQVKLRSFFKV